MKVFKDYSKYYDLLYEDKDYAKEVEYIHQLIQKENPGAKTILNLGCGTGKHDFLLAEKGYSIYAIDFSETMIQVANSENKSENIEFHVADIRDISLNQRFDVVISMFHVLSYQTDNSDLERVFKNAKTHLNENGVFIFDCWNGTGVLADPPHNRVKEVSNDILAIQRNTTATHLAEASCVNVHFDITITERETATEHKLAEDHLMRYLFPDEMKKFGASAGFQLDKLYSWLTDQPPKNDDWYVLYIFK